MCPMVSKSTRFQSSNLAFFFFPKCTGGQNVLFAALLTYYLCARVNVVEVR